MAEQNVDIDVHAAGTETTPRLPSSVVAAAHMSDKGEIDLAAAISHLSELMQQQPIAIRQSEVINVLQEAHERSFYWLADLLFRALTEMNALPQGYAEAMKRTALAVEFFRIAALYDYMEAKRLLEAEQERVKRESQGLPPEGDDNATA